MKRSGLVESYRRFLNSESSSTSTALVMKETQLKSNSSLYFIFEIARNLFLHDADSNFKASHITEVISLITTFDSALLSLIEVHKKNRISHNEEQALENISNSLLSAFRKNVDFVYINRPILDRIINKLLDSDIAIVKSSHDLLYDFYGHLITKHSIYGMVFWMHKNPGKAFNWRRACKEFIILNQLDPSREEEFLENFSSAFKCLTKETSINIYTNSLDYNGRHYFTSDLNARMLELLAVEQTGLEK